MNKNPKLFNLWEWCFALGDVERLDGRGDGVRYPINDQGKNSIVGEGGVEESHIIKFTLDYIELIYLYFEEI